jgi:hypothetical protein
MNTALRSGRFRITRQEFPYVSLSKITAVGPRDELERYQAATFSTDAEDPAADHCAVDFIKVMPPIAIDEAMKWTETARCLGTLDDVKGLNRKLKRLKTPARREAYMDAHPNDPGVKAMRKAWRILEEIRNHPLLTRPVRDWDTKWNSSDRRCSSIVPLEGSDSCQLWCQFFSPWGPPSQVFEQLDARWPRLSFKMVNVLLPTGEACVMMFERDPPVGLRLNDPRELLLNEFGIDAEEVDEYLSKYDGANHRALPKRKAL